MNKFRSLVSILAVLACGSALAQTATNTPPAPTPPLPVAQTSAGSGTFFDSVAGYFTSFNLALDAPTAAARGSLWTGADSLQGNGTVPLANSLGLSYNLYQPATSPVRIGAESVTRNSGVAGTLVSEQIGPNLKLIIHDVTLTAYADGLYDFNPAMHLNKKGKTITDSALGVEIGLRLQKQLTDHTFAGTGVGARLPRNQQVFQVFAGFTF